MSYERRIASQGLKPLTGSRPGPVGEGVPATVRVSGGQPESKDRGHRDLGGVIRQGLELRSRVVTARRNDPSDGALEYDPAQFASYVSLVSGATTISIRTPTTVSTEQATPTGKVRGRTWQFDLILRVDGGAPAGVSIVWPTGIIWQEFQSGYDAETGHVLTLGAPADGYYTPGVGYFYRFTYNEHVQAWVAEQITASSELGATLEDPTPSDPDEDPDDTDGDGELDPGEDATEDPENVYTDPDTGEELVPVAPDPALGNLLALHAGAISYSDNCGHTWRKSTPAPQNAVEFTPMSGEGMLVRTSDDEVYFAPGLPRGAIEGETINEGSIFEEVLPGSPAIEKLAWHKIQLTDEEIAEIAVENGGFESGDLTGWSHVSGSVPQVLGTVQPPQQEGRYYLTTNIDDVNALDFVVRQVVSMPAVSSGSTLKLRAKVWTDPAATAEIELRSEDGLWSIPEVVNTVWQGRRIPGWGRLPSGELLDLVLISGEVAGFTGTGGSGTRQLRVEKSDGTYYTGPVLLTLDKFEWYETMRFQKSQVATRYIPTGSRARFIDYASTFDLEEETLNGLDGGSSAGILFKSGAAMNIAFMGSSMSVRVIAPTGTWAPESYSDGGVIILGTATVPGTGGWNDVELEVPADFGARLGITLRGLDYIVYFDDIRLEYSKEIAGACTAVCRDLLLRRHLLATEDDVYEVKRGQLRRLGAAPFAPTCMAALGDTLHLASGTTLATSANDGVHFETRELAGEIEELIALDASVFARLADGSLYRLGLEITAATLPGAGDVSADLRRQRWVYAGPSGGVQVTDPAGLNIVAEGAVSWSVRKTMPASVATLTRAILPSDGGRWIGFAAGRKDLFWTDDPTTSWKLGRALTAEIKALEEVK